MELVELQKCIRNDTLPNLLIFVGEDYELGNIYIENICKMCHYALRSVSTIADAIVENSRNEVFPENKLFVVKYPQVTPIEQEQIEKINKFKDNKVILVLSSFSKKYKTAKDNEDITVNISPQSKEVFLRMVEPTSKMSKKNIEKLAEICHNNYGRYLRELDKVVQYSEANNISRDSACEKLIEEEIILPDNDKAAFTFVDKLLSAKKDLYKYYQKIPSSERISLLSLIYSNYRNQYITQTVPNATPENTGLAPFVITACKRRAGVYSAEELLNALWVTQRLEQGSKSGMYSEENVVDLLLAEVLL